MNKAHLILTLFFLFILVSCSHSNKQDIVTIPGRAYTSQWANIKPLFSILTINYNEDDYKYKYLLSIIDCRKGQLIKEYLVPVPDSALKAEKNFVPDNTRDFIIWDENDYTGMRLYVIGCVRDCDGTPLYVLGSMGMELYQQAFVKPNTCYNFASYSGFGENSLKLIQDNQSY